MGRIRANAGRLDTGGVYPLLTELVGMEWTGVVRLRSGRKIGAIWLVKGQVTHAVHIEGGSREEGLMALEQLALLDEGTCLCEDATLPPDRTVRSESRALLEYLSLLAGSEHGNPMNLDDAELDRVLEDLRQRVPGLESISVARDESVAASTCTDPHELKWLNRQIHLFKAEDSSHPDTVYLKQGRHTLLMVRAGKMAAVLAAAAQTAPEALFWAGSEAMRKIRSAEDEE